MAAPLRGIKFVEYHQEWGYLADRFGMKRIGSVELRPGVELTPNHIVNLVEMIKQEKPQLLIYGAQNPRLPKQLANETGIKVLRLYSGGGNQPKPTAISNGSIILCVLWCRRLVKVDEVGTEDPSNRVSKGEGRSASLLLCPASECQSWLQFSASSSSRDHGCPCRQSRRRGRPERLRQDNTF